MKGVDRVGSKWNDPSKTEGNGWKGMDRSIWRRGTGEERKEMDRSKERDGTIEPRLDGEFERAQQANHGRRG